MNRLKFFKKGDNDKYKYKATVFFICLIISTFIWMLIKLSDQYATEIVIPVVYSEIPEGKILVNSVDTIIEIRISDRGFALAWVKYFAHKKALSIDLSKQRMRQHMHQYEALVSTQEWSQNFLDQYGMKGKVEQVKPDTIAFYFEDRYSKEVPIKPNINIKYAKQFFAYDSMVLSPKTVTVSGLNSVITNIDEIKTVPVNFTGLNTSLNNTIALQVPFNDPSIQISPSEINVKLSVEKFTESQIEIPINRINQPKDLRIKIFPEKVIIRYLVALKDFKKINSEMFRCVVDLSKITDQGGDRLDVVLKKHPQVIRILSIEPALVDYLVLK